MLKFARTGLIVVACLSSTGWALGQAMIPTSSNSPAVFAQMDPAEMGGDQPMMGRKMHLKDRIAFFEAHLAALHAGLQLSPEQEKLWPTFETSLRSMNKQMQEFREQHKSRPSEGDMMAHLKLMSEGATFRAQQLHNFIDALTPLYGQLNEDQKSRLMILLHGFKELPISRHQKYHLAGHDGEEGFSGMNGDRSPPMDDDKR